MIKNKKIGFYPYIEKDGIGRYISEVNKHLQIDTIKSKYEILSPMQFLFEKINNYDLLHIPNFLVPIRKTAKIVCTIQDIIPLLDKNLFRYEQRLYLKQRISWSLKKADHIIFTSNNTYKDVTSIFNFNNNYSIIPLGVTKPLQNLKRPKNQLKKYFLHVGRRRTHKNIQNIIRAFSQFDTEKYDLVLAGSKDKNDDELDKLALKLGIQKSVKFTGKLSDRELAEFYENAIALIYPSLYEGFGLPILEAMSYKCPVITSNRSSMKEISNNSALMVDPENISDLSSAMSSLIKNQDIRAQFVQKGLRNIKNFEWENTSKKTLEIYSSLLGVNVC